MAIGPMNKVICKLKKEIKIVFWALIVPALLISSLSIAFTSNSIQHAWWKISNLEDFCYLGSCFILPLIVFILISFGRISILFLNWIHKKTDIKKHFSDMERPWEKDL